MKYLIDVNNKVYAYDDSVSQEFLDIKKAELDAVEVTEAQAFEIANSKEWETKVYDRESNSVVTTVDDESLSSAKEDVLKIELSAIEEEEFTISMAEYGDGTPVMTDSKFSNSILAEVLKKRQLASEKSSSVLIKDNDGKKLAMSVADADSILSKIYDKELLAHEIEGLIDLEATDIEDIPQAVIDARDSIENPVSTPGVDVGGIIIPGGGGDVAS